MPHTFESAEFSAGFTQRSEPRHLQHRFRKASSFEFQAGRCLIDLLEEITGRASGHKLLKIGGLAVTFRLYGHGGYYCFRNLFELRALKMWHLLKSGPVRPGDSGAWVCNANATGFGWSGVVIGGDRVSGYAVFSESVESWWQQQGLHLSL